MESSSSTSSVLQDVNALRSLVVSVLPQLLMKLDLIGNKLEHAPTTPNTASATRVEISTQTEGAFVDGNPGVATDEILEDLWTTATLPGGIKVESSSEGGAAEGIECGEDDSADNGLHGSTDDATYGDVEQFGSYSLTQFCDVGSAGSNDTVLNTTEEEWTEQSMAAEEYVINSHAPDVKPDLASTSHMSMNPTVAGSSCNQRPVQKNNMSLLKRRQNSTRPELNQSVKKPYKCSYCSKSFSAQFGVRRHERIHTGEKPFKCNYCPKDFNRRYILVLHERAHTGEKPFKCSYCPKSFNQKCNVDDHERIHTGEKPFKCSYCSKAFKQKGNAVEHEKIHTGEKPFKCSYCSRQFRRRYDVVMHKRRSHGTDSVQM